MSLLLNALLLSATALIGASLLAWLAYGPSGGR